MSEEKKPEGEKEKTPSIDPLSVVVKELEEQRKVLAAMGAGLLELSERVKAKESGGAGGSKDFMEFLKGLFGTGASDPFEQLAKHAEGMAKAADALERFRNPYRLGVGEAALIRLGLRAGMPRYMTKHEMARMEKQMGITGALEEVEEEESEHVKE